MDAKELPWNEIDPLIDRALAEDIGDRDLTTEYLIPEDSFIEAEWVANEPCCLAGLPVIDRLFQKLDPQIKTFWMVEDGERILPGKFGLSKGSAQNILTGERTALNFLQRLSGIATLTASYVEKVQKYGVKIYDTRKTTPTLRVLEKYAVRTGGGVNHRMDLTKMVLIKDNHRNILEGLGVEDWTVLIQNVRRDHPSVQIGIEVIAAIEIQKAVEAGANFILLDNMAPQQIKEIVNQWKGRVVLEASGGIRLENVELYAAAGVDRISIGSLTHSPRSIDICLEVLGVL